MTRITLLALAATTALAHVAAADAAAVQSGFNATALDQGDDFFVGPVALGFTANFFGTSYSQTFVGNNGYVTFGSGRADYTPVGLGSGYVGQPIIAAFFADIDTGGAGNGVVGYGNGVFNGRTAFGVTWDRVGYFNDRVDKLNSFQILLVDRADTGAGNFDIVYNYDQVQWETGSTARDGGVDGLGGQSASVGYNAGQNSGTGSPDGTYYTFAGSQVNGALLDGGANSLAANSNVGVAGRYLFNVRNGAVTPPPVSDVPEPASWAMMVAGFGAVGAAVRRGPRRTAVSFG